MAKTRQVALLFPMMQPHMTRLMRGITDYAEQHGHWSLHFNPESEGSDSSVRVLAGWDGDGALALVARPAEAKVARELGLPVVNLSSSIDNPGLPRVCVDNLAVGRLAADHLLERGFRRFAYYGLKSVWYAQQRGRGFREALEQHGAACSMIEGKALSPGRPWRDSHEREFELLRGWLRTLKPPVGLLASHDYRATMIISSCKEVGLRVPNDVAVIGVNNDTLICNFCTIPISSVSRNDWKVGYEAAALLDRLMKRRSVSVTEIVIPPDRVELRRSTDVLAVDDPMVETVVMYIREHLAEDFNVDQLARLVPLSQRWLQQRFKKCLGETLHEFLCRARVERAKKLLIGEQKMRIAEIARECGFNEARQLRKVFERIEGITPTQFQRSWPTCSGKASNEDSYRTGKPKGYSS